MTGVTASGVTASGATISWTMSVSGTCVVNWGTTTSYTGGPTTGTSGTACNVPLPGLSPSTPYHYQAQSASTYSGVGYVLKSADATFTTTAGSGNLIIGNGLTGQITPGGLL